MSVKQNRIAEDSLTIMIQRRRGTSGNVYDVRMLPTTATATYA